VGQDAAKQTNAAYTLDDCSTAQTLPNDSWTGLSRNGSSREEREFKYSFAGPTVANSSAGALATTIFNRLAAAIRDESLWEAPKTIGTHYRHRAGNDYPDTTSGRDAVTNTAFFDVYFDAADDVNLRNDASYRFRQRFDDLGAFADYASGGTARASRAETQAKTSRRFFEPGNNEVMEHRYENNGPFHVRSAAELGELLCALGSGKASETTVSQAAQGLVDHLKTRGVDSISHGPSLVLLTERRRQHLGIPQFTQSTTYVETFIVTVDRAQVFEPRAMIDAISSRGTLPDAIATFTEVEVEFERNASELANGPLREAFLQDQKTIMSQIQAAFTGDINLKPASRSKYMQGSQLLRQSQSNLPTMLNAFGNNDGWTGTHPRVFADVGGDLFPDLVGFGNAGVYVSKGAAGTFSPPTLWVANFGADLGWDPVLHPRHLHDVNGDKKADIVAFAADSVLVSLSNGTDAFAAPEAKLAAFTFGNGGWRDDEYPRHVVDLNLDGNVDIVGFGADAVWASYGTGGGNFASPERISSAFHAAHGWRVGINPRHIVNVDEDPRPDIVGFGNDGVYVSRNTDAGFTEPMGWVANYHADAGWRDDTYPRVLADVNNDRLADIVGFGHDGVFVSLSSGNGFSDAAQWSAVYGYSDNAGGFRVGQHPRFLADVDGDGRSDIVSMANDGIAVSRALDDTFADPVIVARVMGVNQGWSSHHLRLIQDIDLDGRADAIGFSDTGVQLGFLQ
jgi:hypothetical protein